MRLNLTDIYKILANVTERENDKLKTFAALKFTEQFNAVAFDKNYKYNASPNEGIFYSKAWDDLGRPTQKMPVEFPALISFSNTMRTANNFNPIYSVEIYTVEIDESKVKAWEIQMTDLDSYLVLVLRELQKYVYVQDIPSEGWYHLEDAELLGGRINGWLRERIKTRQISLTRGYEQTPKRLLTVGTSIEIEGCF